MMKQTGTVIKTEYNRALVAVPRPSACGENCQSCAGGCQARGHSAWVDNPQMAQAGDRVIITVSDAALLRSALVVYGLPLLLFFIVYATVLTLTDSTPWAIGLSLGSFLVSLLLLRLADKRLAPRPQITEILQSNQTGKDEAHGI